MKKDDRVRDVSFCNHTGTIVWTGSEEVILVQWDDGDMQSLSPNDVKDINEPIGEL